MSAFLDSFTSGGYGDWSPVATANEVGGSSAWDSLSPYASGAMQALTAIGTGYLARRADVDIQQRLAGTMPYPQQWGVGASVSYTQPGPRPGYQQGGTLRLDGLLPWLLIGGFVYLVTKK